MADKDKVKSEWVSNWVQTEIYEQMRKDRDEVRNQVEGCQGDL